MKNYLYVLLAAVFILGSIIVLVYITNHRGYTTSVSNLQPSNTFTFSSNDVTVADNADLYQSDENIGPSIFTFLLCKNAWCDCRTLVCYGKNNFHYIVIVNRKEQVEFEYCRDEITVNGVVAKSLPGDVYLWCPHELNHLKLLGNLGYVNANDKMKEQIQQDIRELSIKSGCACPTVVLPPKNTEQNTQTDHN